MPDTLVKILEAVDLVLGALSGFPVVGQTAAISQALERIVLKAAQAHQELVGAPLDMTKLHEIQPPPED